MCHLKTKKKNLFSPTFPSANPPTHFILKSRIRPLITKNFHSPPSLPVFSLFFSLLNHSVFLLGLFSAQHNAFICFHSFEIHRCR